MRRQFDFWIGVPLVRFLSFFARKPTPAVPKRPQKLLVIKLAAFGDSIILIPTLHAIREVLPDTEIDWLATPINRTLASLVPYVDRVIVLHGFGLFSVLKLVFQLRRRRYDMVIDFEQWSRGSALIAFATGAPERFGFAVSGQERHILYTRSLEKTFSHHERDDFFHLAALALPLRDTRGLELWESPAGKREVETLVPQLLERHASVKWVLLHPGCGADGLPREWPIACYSRFAAGVSKLFSVQFIVTGGPDEKEKTSNLARQIPGCVNVAGQLSWEGIISLVKQMDLVVSGNTGIMHVAAAWQRPQIALHGPTDERLWGPLNDRAIVLRTTCPECPCLKLGFEYHRVDQACMEKISIESVLAATRQLLH